MGADEPVVGILAGQRRQEQHGVAVLLLFLQRVKGDADGLAIRFVTEDERRPGGVDGAGVHPLLQIDECQLRPGQHLHVLRRVGVGQHELEALLGLVPLPLPDLAQTETDLNVGIVGGFLEQPVVDLVGLRELAEVVQRFGEVELRAGVARVGVEEVLERGACLLRLAAAEVEVGLLPLEVDVGGIGGDKWREQGGGFEPVAVLLIELDELQHRR